MMPRNKPSRYRRLKQAQRRAKLQTVRQIGLKLVMIFSLTIVALGVPYLIFNIYLKAISSDYFQTKTIDVYGHHYLDTDYILARADIRPGVNIFDVDQQEIEEALLSDPWIASVKVETSLPDTLTMTVTEFQPAAMLISGTQWQLIDPTGFPFKTFEPTDPSNELFTLPFLTGPSVEDLNNEDIRRLVVSAIKLCDLYQNLELSKTHRISEVHIDPMMGLTLILDTGLRIQMGSDRFPERLQRFQIVYQTLLEDHQTPDYILIDQDKNIDKITVGNDIQLPE